MAFTRGPLHGKEVIHHEKRRKGCQTWAYTKMGKADVLRTVFLVTPSTQLVLLGHHYLGPGLLKAAWEERRKHPQDGRVES